MDPATLILLASKGIGVAIEAIALFTKAVEAANNGDMAEAERFLEDARKQYGEARAKFDEALAERAANNA